MSGSGTKRPRLDENETCVRMTHPNAYKNASKLADDSNPHFNYIFGTSSIAGNASLISAAYSSAS